MPTDELGKKQGLSEMRSSRARSYPQDSLGAKRWKRGLLATGVVAVLGSVVTLIPRASLSRQIGPERTHKITRGELIVTVTEQGTLESSENTEIKCKARCAEIPIIWVIESGSEVKPGDELVRLETLVFEDRLSATTKYAHWSRSSAERSKADVVRAHLAISEYLEGRYRSEMMTLEKDLAIAESNLRTAQNMLAHAKMMAERSYVSALEVEEKTFEVTQAELSLGVKKTEIEEGATVYMGQTLLLMPDLSRMQVKVGIHESFIDRIKPGLAARVTLPDKTLEGEVSSVALVTSPAGWWTGNVVKYDTIIKLPPGQGLRPGMSAEVEVIIDRHENVLTIPVAAVVETDRGNFCWVKTATGSKRRSLKLGDTNNVLTVVKAGLKEGDQVVLHPFAFEEAQTEDLKPLDEAKSRQPGSVKSSDSGTKPSSPRDSNKQKSKLQLAKPKKVYSKPKTK